MKWQHTEARQIFTHLEPDPRGGSSDPRHDLNLDALPGPCLSYERGKLQPKSCSHRPSGQGCFFALLVHLSKS